MRYCNPDKSERMIRKRRPVEPGQSSCVLDTCLLKRNTAANRANGNQNELLQGIRRGASIISFHRLFKVALPDSDRVTSRGLYSQRPPRWINAVCTLTLSNIQNIKCAWYCVGWSKVVAYALVSISVCFQAFSCVPDSIRYVVFVRSAAQRFRTELKSYWWKNRYWTWRADGHARKKPKTVRVDGRYRTADPRNLSHHLKRCQFIREEVDFLLFYSTHSRWFFTFQELLWLVSISSCLRRCLSFQYRFPTDKYQLSIVFVGAYHIGRGNSLPINQESFWKRGRLEFSARPTIKASSTLSGFIEQSSASRRLWDNCEDRSETSVSHRFSQVSSWGGDAQSISL